MTKANGELLIARLKEWDLVDCASDQQKKKSQTASLQRKTGNDVSGLFDSLGIACSTDEWRLFFDVSSFSLKAVFLHSGNKYPSLLLAHSVHLKEDYRNVRLLLETLNHNKYRWEGIEDFKTEAFLMRSHRGFTKNRCFFYLWDNGDRAAHYQKNHWPPRTDTIVGAHNIKHEPLVNPQKVLFPPLHIKLGVIKQFVTALEKESAAFKYLQDLYVFRGKSKSICFQRQK